MLLRAVLVWCLASWSGLCTAQDLIPAEKLPGGVLLVVKDLGGAAGPDSPIFLASNLVGWNPADPTMKLDGRSDLRWQIMLPMSTRDQRLAFKFTRGAWERTECNPDFSGIDNRLLPMVDPSTIDPDKPYIVEFEIPAWDDQSPAAHATLEANDPTKGIEVAGGSIVKLEFAGGGGSMRGVAREMLIWLPPGYHDTANAQRAYPVLYMHDGQNLFEKGPGIAGDWFIDETAVELIGKGMVAPFIVVGIPHAGSSRASEYLMIDVTDGTDGFMPDADRYLEVLADQIVPRVESAVRADARRESRIVGGASLGGLIALYAAYERPEVFGSVIALSPSIRLRGQTIWTQVLERPSQWPQRVFLGAGGHEAGDDDEASKAYVDELRSLAGVLEANDVDTELMIDPDAEHNEEAWAARFGEAVRFLLGH